MTLITLGGLRLPGSDFRQAKLLLLAAWLDLNGPQPRRAAAELFWARAADPMNSLSVALRKLRAAGLAEGDEEQVWARVGTDAGALQAALREGQMEGAARAYTGAFAAGLALGDEGEELEEWLYATRETLALGVRGALLYLAERDAAAGHWAQAGLRAEQGYALSAAPPPEPAALARLGRVLSAAEHPLAAQVAREARAFGIVTPGPQAARGTLRRVFLGRALELETLLALRPGQWGWLRGGPGSGRTSVLQALEAGGWQRLPARSGLPYATLEPLLGGIGVGSGTGPGEEAVLQKLLRLEGEVCIDDWEHLDAESRTVLTRMQRLQSRLRVVVAANGPPPGVVDALLTLNPLTAADLVDTPGLYEATDGVPGLVGAALRGEPPARALEARLSGWAQADQELFAALALLDDPDLTLARTALELGPSDLAACLERLLASGLTLPSGQVLGRPAALAWLTEHPATEARLALALARQLSGARALPLYRRARALWDAPDLPAVQGAYLAWSGELLRRGFARQAAEVLVEAPASAEVTLRRARALERAGLHLKALELTEGAANPELQVVRAAVLTRLGRADEARAALADVTVTSLEGQAERHTALGRLAMTAGEFEQAEREFRRAANKWLATGQMERWVVELTNQAVARSSAGEHQASAFQEALEAAGDNPRSRALVLLNQAFGFSRQHQVGEALHVGQQALNLALEAGALEVAAAALYNLATFHEHLDDPGAAREAYRRCLQLAQTLEDHRLIGLSLIGLSVLDGDRDAGREGIERLRTGGYLHMAAHIEQALGEFMTGSGAASHA